MSDRFSVTAGKLTVRHKPSEYRSMAAMCLEIGNQMSLDSDRMRMADLAQNWLELAQTSEAEKLSEASEQDLKRDLRRQSIAV
ncbi:MAG: hypothetical protein ACJ8EA_00205 [Xanthobacteraceae bacterium]